MNSKLLILCVSLFALTALGQQKPVYSDVEAGKHTGEDAIVTGKLVTVSTSGKGTTYLNFGDRFPRQTFSGVVFARNEAAVGDIKQYEGKEVVLTGRIELSPDQKPQIVISRPDQIKLASANTLPMPSPAPVPAVAPLMPAPKPSPTPIVEVPLPKSPAARGKIALTMNWHTPGLGGESARKDLAKLFGAHGSASESTDVDTSIEIYPGIQFLMPLTDAKKTLRLEGVASVKTRIMTPGMLQGSFNSYSFSGVFAGGFTRINLITDSTDQVVSVLLVDSNTRIRTPNEPDTTGYHTYNFISGSTKATDDFLIKHQIATSSASAGVVVVDTMFIDPTDPENSGSRFPKGKSSKFSKPKTGKVLERLRWFVPVPVVNLILRSVR